MKIAAATKTARPAPIEEPAPLDAEPVAEAAASPFAGLARDVAQVGAGRARAANDSGEEAKKRQLSRNVVAARLRAAREFAGLSQTDAARSLGWATPAQLSQHEQGKRLMPIPELIRAADLYGTSVDYFLGLTSEPERDPARALRAATVRGIRGMLDSLAIGLVDSISAHAALAGPNVVSARAIVSAGQALIDALGVVLRAPEFDDIRGGASVVRAASEFEVRLDEVRVAIQRFDRLDTDLRERVAAAVAAGDSELNSD